MPLRYGVVAALVLFGLISIYYAAAALWEPRGTLGITTDYDAVIRSVAAGGPAARAGIHRGDHVLLAKTPYRMRRFLSGVGANPRVGESVRFHLAQAGKDREVTLVAVRSHLTAADRSVLFFQCVASIVFVVVGAALILLRPSLATWGFGLYCLIILPTGPSPFLLPIQHGALPLLFFYDVLQVVGVVGLIVFALEFPRRPKTGWRKLVRRGLPVIFIVLAVMMVYPDFANQVLGVDAAVENRFLQVALGLMWLLALCIAWDSYRRIEAEERERLNWVVIGLSIGLVAAWIGETMIYSSLIPIVPPAWLLNLLASLNVLLPLTIAHAVIRRRVLDIDFVISNAILYTGFTLVLIATFGLVDWAFTKYIENFELSVVINAAISVLLAFVFDAVHDRAQKVVQTVLFRQRLDAQSRLQNLGRRLRDVQSSNIVELAVTEDAAETLGLSSAAFFRRSDTSTFKRTAAVGWDVSDWDRIEEGNALITALRQRNEPVRLGKFEWNHGTLPTGIRSPLIALPMIHRSELQGVVLYGAHQRGEDIDSQEVEILENLLDCACIGLDHIDTERLRETYEAQNKVIATLQARVAELETTRSPKVIRSTPV